MIQYFYRLYSVYSYYKTMAIFPCAATRVYYLLLAVFKKSYKRGELLLELAFLQMEMVKSSSYKAPASGEVFASEVWLSIKKVGSATIGRGGSSFSGSFMHMNLSQVSGSHSLLGSWF